MRARSSPMRQRRAGRTRDRPRQQTRRRRSPLSLAVAAVSRSPARLQSGRRCRSRWAWRSAGGDGACHSPNHPAAKPGQDCRPRRPVTPTDPRVARIAGLPTVSAYGRHPRSTGVGPGAGARTRWKPGRDGVSRSRAKPPRATRTGRLPDSNHPLSDTLDAPDVDTSKLMRRWPNVPPWLSILLSRLASLRASASFERSKCRSRTNARIISMFTWTAPRLLSTVETIATPCGCGNRRPRRVQTRPKATPRPRVYADSA
jgi:hypothetical protein